MFVLQNFWPIYKKLFKSKPARQPFKLDNNYGRKKGLYDWALVRTGRNLSWNQLSDCLKHSEMCLFICFIIYPPVVSLSLCLSVCLSIHLSVCLPVCLSIYLSIYLTVCLSLCPSVHLPVCPSVYLSIRTSVRPSVCPSFCLSLCMSVCLPVLPSIHLCHFFEAFAVMSCDIKRLKNIFPVEQIFNINALVYYTYLNNRLERWPIG